MNKAQNKCIFIIDLLDRKGPMTRKEINDEIRKAFPSEADLPRSTWNRYLETIANSTPYRIVYDNAKKAYKLHKRAKGKESNDALKNYLMASYNVMESAPLLMKHSNIIYNADVVAGTAAINIILKAIDEHRGLTFTYTSFVNNTTKTRNFIPYFLSTWEGRWYLVAEAETHPGSLYMYALDRMSDIKLSFEKVKRSVKITAEEYFRYSYGIQHSTEEDAIDIVIRVFGTEVKYVRSKKIHPSQKEINSCEKYADFRLHLAPCYNFYQQLMWHRENLVVLEPESVKNEIKDILEKMNKQYI